MLRALNHPIRRRILGELGDRPASAREVACALGEQVSLVAYHLNQILAQECEVVTLVETVARQGTLEKFYALNPAFWGPSTSSEMVAGSPMVMPVEVDASALEEISEAQRDFRDRIAAVAESSRIRAGDRDRPTHLLVTGVLPLADGQRGYAPAPATSSS